MFYYGFSRLLAIISALFVISGSAFTAHAAAVAYVDSTGQVTFFDAKHPPAWAVPNPVPSKSVKSTQTTFNVTFQDLTANGGASNNIGFADPALGAERRAVVTRMLKYLGDVLNQSTAGSCDIVFNVSQTDGSGFLASAGPFFLTDPSGFANGFAFDHITTGVDPFAGGADITCTVDFGYPWYTGSATTVTPGQYDLYSVLLHEMTHGLGILSLSSSSGTSTVSGGSPGVYTRYDSLMRTGNGAVMFNPTTFSFQGTAGNLTGNDNGLVFGGSAATAAFSGLHPPLYAPATFSSGSSLSHFSLGIAGPVVMKPSISSGVPIRNYAAFEIGALKDIGYVNAQEPTYPLGGFVSSTYSIGETTGNAAITVSLAAAPGPGFSASIDWTATAGTATNGKDFTVVSGTLNFGPFDTTKAFNVPILDDGFREPNETINLALSTPQGMILDSAHANATLTILDNDSSAGVDFSSATYCVSEGAGTLVVTLQLTAAAGAGSPSVLVTTTNGSANASDYTAVNQLVTFNPTDTQKTVSIPILNDTHHEIPETFTIALSSPSNLVLLNTNNPATVSILDDDTDTDGDGISDTDETSGFYGFVTNPNRLDTDGDTISDFDEISGSLGAITSPVLADSDNDGVSDSIELSLGTDPNNANDFPALTLWAVPRYRAYPDTR